MVSTMRWARAMGESANRITLLRDRDGDGVAEVQDVFMEGLNQPFGMSLIGNRFYVGNTDGVVVFPYEPGADRITAPGRKIVDFKPGGHWTRSLLPSPDGKSSTPASARSLISPMRACRWRRGAPPSGSSTLTGTTDICGRVTQCGWPGLGGTDGVLWTVVNERDGLGDETPPTI